MEGLWHTRFNAGPAHGDGIVVLRNGEVLGGDASHIYVGSYQRDGSLVYFNVRVSRWLGEDSAFASEPPQAFLFHGSVQGDSATVSGHSDDHLDLTVAVELHRAA
jgi:T3SS negative regulator,GrlR